MKQSPKNPPLILIHGFRGSPLGLKPIVDILAKDHLVFAPSIPPFASAKPLPDYTPDTYADFLAEFIQQKGLKNPILIGHSMGSIIVAATAEKYPNLINQKVFFLSPISQNPSPFIASLQNFVAYSPSALVSFLTTAYLFIPKDWQLFQKSLRLTEECAVGYTSRKDVTKAAKFSSTHCLKDFKLPANKQYIFIAGESDRLIKQEHTSKLAKKLHGDLEFIPNTGHLINYEAPQTLTTIIKKYL